VCGTHAGLDGAEGMFDRLTSLAQFLRVLVEPALNGFQNVLMLPSRDPSLLGGSAAMLDGAVLTDVGLSVTDAASTVNAVVL
jgi:hypothetical protein